ncbi:hypothetical protein DPEC_G00302240 [Dallia pectoralis]|uniref:Uncharacterized protein n=1 Tax=Dallia pectoralis TaxID=75939 RepID=A0ACC2FH11_DALPE|nr:hypothetical protein DPEC_G00302240 [Dallia pectoralis]
MKHGDTGLPALLEKHGEVFNGELGSMKNITVKLNIKPDSKPKLMKARPVPYAIRPKVEADLDALVNNKVLEPVTVSPFEDRMFLVMVDAHSKWPEVAIMKSTTAGKTIEKLGEVFNRFGSPLQLVSDNGPQLVSQEMTTFLQVNGVQHIRPPTTKEIVQRQQERQVERRGFKAKDREFNPGETVLARNYLNGPKWVPAKVIAQSGPVSYTVQTTEDTIWKRHADQLLSSKAAPTEPTIVSGQDLLLGENQSEHSPPPRGSQAPPQDPDVTNSKQMCDETLMQTTQLPTPESTAEHKNGVNENQVESRYPTRERRAPMRMNL